MEKQVDVKFPLADPANRGDPSKRYRFDLSDWELTRECTEKDAIVVASDDSHRR